MIILLAAQLLAPEVLPPQIQPALDEYGSCIFGRLSDENAKRQKRLTAPKVDRIFADCSAVRTAAIAKAEAALESDARFTDQKHRKAFVANRFEGLDSLTRDMALGRGDPDNWKPDAPNQ